MMGGTIAVRLVACAAVITACVPADRGSMPGVVDSAGVRIITIGVEPDSIDRWTLAPNARLVPEGGDSSGFGFVGPVRLLHSGGVVIGDHSAVRLVVYDSNGRLVRVLGRRGDGPGELRQIGSVSVTAEDSIVTFDPRLQRFTVWHPDTGFVRSHQLPVDASVGAWAADAWPWPPFGIVVLQLEITPLESVPPGAGMRRWPHIARLTLRDTVGRIVATSPDFDGMYSGLDDRGDRRLPFSHQPFVAVSADRVYYGSGERFSISYVNERFEWAGDLRWPSRRESLTAAEVEAVKQETYAGMPSSLSGEQRRVRIEPSFSPEILPSERPAIGRVLVADDGRIWIERFTAMRLGSPTSIESDEWTILETDGHPVGRLQLPVRARLEDVRDGAVALVVRDSLDVQRVAIHALNPR